MAKYLLEAAGVNWLAIFALLTFFFIFTLATVLVLGGKKETYERIGRQPLVDSYSPDDKSLEP